MDQQDNLLAVIEKIYSVPIDGNGWGDFLKGMMARTGCRWGLMYVSGFYSDDTALSLLLHKDTSVLTAYVDHYAYIDPRSCFLAGRSGTISLGTELVDDKEFQHTEIYNDFLVKESAEQSLIISIPGFTDGTNYMSFLRSALDPQFTDEDRDFFQTLIPHLQQSLSLHRQIVLKTDKESAGLNALDLVAFGIVLLDPNGKVHYLNRSAEKIVARRDGFSIDANNICKAGDGKTTKNLLQLIHEASLTTSGLSLSYGGKMTISRPFPLRPYVVNVSPVNSDTLPISNTRLATAIFIIDPDHNVKICINAIAEHYGLTLAEARLASEFANGISMDQYCEDYDVTRNTFRGHLKQILSKTGTHSQTELAQLIFSFQLPFDAEE